jgi:integrase
LSAVLRTAVKWGHLRDNPARGVDLPVLRTVRPKWRTYSSWAHDKGVRGKVVADLMGHAKVDTTLNIYTQVIDESKRAAAQKIGEELMP